MIVVVIEVVVAFASAEWFPKRLFITCSGALKGQERLCLLAVSASVYAFPIGMYRLCTAYIRRLHTVPTVLSADVLIAAAVSFALLVSRHVMWSVVLGFSIAALAHPGACINKYMHLQRPRPPEQRRKQNVPRLVLP